MTTACVLLSLGAFVAGGASSAQTHASNARWLVHNLSFGVLSTTSAQFNGVAFGNPQSFVDGTIDNSTGNIYLYVSDDDASMQDVKLDSEITFTLSEEMSGNGCTRTGLDPEDPMCMRVVLIGTMENVSTDAREWATQALFERHPGMKHWPQQGHGFYVATVKLKSIWIIDEFGGAATIDPEEFLAASPITPPGRNGTSPLPKPSRAPIFTEKASTARWMAHELGFGVLSTTSTNAGYKGVAFGNPQSFADGTVDNSTGRLYWYMSPLDASAQDLSSDSRATWALSEQMLNNYCTKEKQDPEDPRCTRCVFVGALRNVTQADALFPAARGALFARHPEMKEWPTDHHFSFFTMDIEAIWLIDMFGGASHVKPADYYKAKP